jgi:cytochrome bd-type quinol oxidase subunit 2
LYTVLAGADFGAGWWQLTAGKGPDAASIRDHAHQAMGPVWEANHVWLIFVLTVIWTAYPSAFGSIASTLSIPLFIAAVGIIFRGTAYALRAGASTMRELSAIDTAFALSSILTPFALGAAIGGIASRRVPVGNAAGDQFSSWLNPTSLLIGVLAVATAAYLAAVFLCADAARLGEPALERKFRTRALTAGLVSGAIALAGVAVLRSDAQPLYHRLVEGRGLIGLIASIVAGCATLALVWWKRYEASRYTAALAVAAIVGDRLRARGSGDPFPLARAALPTCPKRRRRPWRGPGRAAGPGAPSAHRPRTGAAVEARDRLLRGRDRVPHRRRRSLGAYARRLLPLRLHRRRVSRGSSTRRAAHPPQEPRCRESGPAVSWPRHMGSQNVGSLRKPSG